MLIIPDIHGRDFWRLAVMGHEDESIIFLGDYVDPYPDEDGVEPVDGLVALLEVIDFKRQHPDNVVLLLGNHDLSYISEHLYRCRHDDEHHNIIRQALLQNLSLFQIAYETEMDGRRYLFSHAGILPAWLKEAERFIGPVPPGCEVEMLNRAFAAGLLYEPLGMVGWSRGGECVAGSMVWADLDDHSRLLKTECLPEVYQVFGHTQQYRGPLITPHFACLDYRQAFQLTPDHQFHAITALDYILPPQPEEPDWAALVYKGEVGWGIHASELSCEVPAIYEAIECLDDSNTYLIHKDGHVGYAWVDDELHWLFEPIYDSIQRVAANCFHLERDGNIFYWEDGVLYTEDN